MKNLNRNQTIAVFAALGLLAYVLFSGAISDFFNPPTTNMSENNQEQFGVMIQDTVVGTGIAAAAGDTLTVHYVGTLEDGRVFDSSRDTNVPFGFVLGAGGVIRGWDEGMVGMQVGGRRILIISPEYGYGNQGIGTIPPNSTLIFEVELLDIDRP